MKYFGFFEELSHGEAEGGSLKGLISEIKQIEHKEIVDYLKQGKLFIASPGVVEDVLSNKKKVIGPAHILTDGRWAWPEDLIYYVENYNVKLPREFVDYMKSNRWTVPYVDIHSIGEINIAHD